MFQYAIKTTLLHVPESGSMEMAQKEDACHTSVKNPTLDPLECLCYSEMGREDRRIPTGQVV